MDFDSIIYEYNNDLEEINTIDLQDTQPLFQLIKVQCTLLNKMDRQLLSSTKTPDLKPSVKMLKSSKETIENIHQSFIESLLGIKPLNYVSILENEIKLIIQFRKRYQRILEHHIVINIESFLNRSQLKSKYFQDITSKQIFNEIKKSSDYSADDLFSRPDIVFSRLMTAIDWVNKTFPSYKRDMASVNWLRLHSEYGDDEHIDPELLDKAVTSYTSSSPEITPTKKYEYIIKSAKKVKI